MEESEEALRRRLRAEIIADLIKGGAQMSARDEAIRSYTRGMGIGSWLRAIIIFCLQVLVAGLLVYMLYLGGGVLLIRIGEDCLDYQCS